MENYSNYFNAKGMNARVKLLDEKIPDTMSRLGNTTFSLLGRQ